MDIPILETKRLRLRPFCADDFDDYAAMRADPEVARFLSGEAWPPERAWRHLAYVVGQWKLEDPGMWAVEHRETAAFLGMVGFTGPTHWPGFELAWTLARRWWGHGYATEGASAALTYAFEVLERDRVISLIDPGNHRSIRVAERLGETLQGRFEHFGKEMLCYGIDRLCA
ncbi:MAG: GNAT family N-acetyltransferase [Acidobacteriota bacterium]